MKRTILIAVVLTLAGCLKGGTAQESTVEERLRESQARADFAQALNEAQADHDNPDAPKSPAVAAARDAFLSACRACASYGRCEDEVARIEREPKRVISWSPCR